MIDIDEIEKIPFFFIVARGRSGTTMLQNILDANENTIIPFESRLIIHLKQKYFKVKKWDDNILKSFITDLYLDKKFGKYWNINRKYLTTILLSIPHQKITFQLLCKIIYLNYPSPFKKEKILLIGDKNPIYSVFIKELKQIFPNAKYIHLVRDYRANIVSDIKTFGYEKLPIVSNGWVTYNRNIEKEKEKDPNKFLTVRYEDLVESPEKNTKALCGFLGISYKENMLHFNKAIKNTTYKNASDSLKTEISNTHPHLLEPINTNQINKWEDYLIDDKKELVEYIAGKFGERYGYNPTSHYSSKFSIKRKAFIGNIRQQYNLFIIKNYYNLPTWLRNFMSNSSSYLFRKFNYTNYFNSADFRFKENTKT